MMVGALTDDVSGHLPSMHHRNEGGYRPSTDCPSLTRYDRQAVPALESALGLMISGPSDKTERV